MMKNNSRKLSKKLLVSVLAAMCLLGTTAMAEGVYTPGEHTYSNSIVDGARTVIIYNGDTPSSDNIYYIYQCDDINGFSGFKAFLKMNAPAGEYTVRTNVAEKNAKFQITAAEVAVEGSTEMEFLDAELNDAADAYSVGYQVVAHSGFNESSKVIMILDEKAYITDLVGNNSIINWNGNVSSVEGDGQVVFEIHLDGVEQSYITQDGGKLTPSFRMFFKK